MALLSVLSTPGYTESGYGSFHCHRKWQSKKLIRIKNYSWLSIAVRRNIVNILKTCLNSDFTTSPLKLSISLKYNFLIGNFKGFKGFKFDILFKSFSKNWKKKTQKKNANHTFLSLLYPISRKSLNELFPLPIWKKW